MYESNKVRQIVVEAIRVLYEYCTLQANCDECMLRKKGNRYSSGKCRLAGKIPSAWEEWEDDKNE